MLENLLSQKIESYVKPEAYLSFREEQSHLINFIKDFINRLSDDKKMVISEIFNLECDEMTIDLAIISQVLLNIKERIKAKHARTLVALDEESFLNLRVILDQDMILRKNGWQWSLDHPDQMRFNLLVKPDEYPILIKPSTQGVIEEDLSPFSYAIFDLSKKSLYVHDLLQEILSFFDEFPKEQEQEIENAIVQQVKQALSSGILIEDQPRFRLSVLMR